MIQVCLVSAPTITEFRDLTGVWDEDSRRVPLGVLVLAAELEAAGWRPQVVNLDEGYASWISRGCDRGRYAEHAAEELAGRNADVYGLGSICSSYPLTLRIASALRRLRPSSRIVLGGPQATSTDVETLAAFPAVDLVVRGEGDATVPELIRAIQEGGDLSRVRGLTHRLREEVVRTPDAEPVADLDSLPRAAYHLCTPARRHPLPLEVGRGCPFGCSFCSTSRFFGRRFRMRSPERIVEDMHVLRRTYGIRRFELVHDNFTVDRRRVLAFCEAVAGARFSWTCSSRTDSIDEELLEAMKRAGCAGIFFGVESGSAAIQRAIGKGIDLAGARQRLRLVGRRRIRSAVAFMAGFPEETPRDLGETVDFFVDTLRSDFLDPQISLLSPLPGTPVHQRHRHELVLDEIPSDIAFQGEEQDPVDRELIAAHPELFSSFYAVPAPSLDRRDLHELRCFLLASLYELRWLLVSAARIAGGGMELFRAFQAWRRIDTRGWSYGALNTYYRGPAFRRHFTRFVRRHLAAQAGEGGPALEALADLTARLPARPSAQPADGRRARSAARGRHAGPGLAPGVVVSRIGCDGAALVRCARRAGDFARVPRRESFLVARWRRRRLEVGRLSSVAADLLALCNGKRTVDAIARAFARSHPEVAGVAGRRACAVGLAALMRTGFLVE